MSGKQNLPASVAELVDLIGLDKAMKLVRSLGGTTFPVPKRQTKLGELRYNMLADVVGLDAADALVKHFGGGELYVPRCAAALQAARDAEINAYFVAETRNGRSSAEVVFCLAMRYKLSDRRVWNILKTLPRTDAQFSLFEKIRA
ncbi:Mor transcription activator family protein [Solidesulfovibrio carbinolicus]|uniref:DNA transposition protein n=1 Tax=Solidesulfovibrio carbinolicus TaxID=296842 RepID=A0A4P6I037_9BACT|nr:Mor transcription activator family protein [Solidesulfovibrio carbinolicus]QAZ67049.1 DNA transposition protein [Solidesulfovibrio carbinolicus]